MLSVQAQCSIYKTPPSICVKKITDHIARNHGRYSPRKTEIGHGGSFAAVSQHYNSYYELPFGRYIRGYTADIFRTSKFSVPSPTELHALTV